ncbi:hypothetical protein, partial [Neptunomonas phycophila]|uniref:hypothetical protein n=1 Tax=Neptunomonas phycophila TaxID=1572645 RepID=UPI0035111DB8
QQTYHGHFFGRIEALLLRRLPLPDYRSFSNIRGTRHSSVNLCLSYSKDGLHATVSFRFSSGVSALADDANARQRGV